MQCKTCLKTKATYTAVFEGFHDLRACKSRLFTAKFFKTCAGETPVTRLHAYSPVQQHENKSKFGNFDQLLIRCESGASRFYYRYGLMESFLKKFANVRSQIRSAHSQFTCLYGMFFTSFPKPFMVLGKKIRISLLLICGHSV